MELERGMVLLESSLFHWHCRFSFFWLFSHSGRAASETQPCGTEASKALQTFPEYRREPRVPPVLSQVHSKRWLHVIVSRSAVYRSASQQQNGGFSCCHAVPKVRALYPSLRQRLGPMGCEICGISSFSRWCSVYICDERRPHSRRNIRSRS